MLNLGHEILQKVMEKVMESHGILTGQKCTNPGKENYTNSLLIRSEYNQGDVCKTLITLKYLVNISISKPPQKERGLFFPW